MKKPILSLVTLMALSLTLAISAQASYQASYIDSTGGTYFGGISLGAAEQAVVFTTGTNGPFRIGDLKLGMRTSTAGSYDFTVGLRAVDGSNNPTGTDLVSVLLNTGPMVYSMNENVLLDFTSLGSLGTYGLAANTPYALVVQLGSTPDLGWGAVAEAFPTPDPQYGFSVQKNSVAGGGGSWNQIFGPVTSYDMAIGPGAASSVPEPSTYALFALGLGGLAFWKRRQARA